MKEIVGATITPLDIQIYSSVPIYIPQYRLAEIDKVSVNEEVENILKAGIIQKS